jgi:hypothetical protein
VKTNPVEILLKEALKHVIQSQKRLRLIDMAGKMRLYVDLDVTRKRK